VELQQLLKKARDKYKEVEGRDYGSASLTATVTATPATARPGGEIISDRRQAIEVVAVQSAQQLLLPKSSKVSEILMGKLVSVSHPQTTAKAFTRVEIQETDSEDDNNHTEDISPRAEPVMSSAAPSAQKESFTRIPIQVDDDDEEEEGEEEGGLQTAPNTISGTVNTNSHSNGFTRVPIQVDDEDEEEEEGERVPPQGLGSGASFSGLGVKPNQEQGFTRIPIQMDEDDEDENGTEDRGEKGSGEEGFTRIAIMEATDSEDEREANASQEAEERERVALEHKHRGNQFMLQGDLNGALEAYNASLQASPLGSESSSVHANRALVHIKLKVSDSFFRPRYSSVILPPPPPLSHIFCRRTFMMLSPIPV
jgi:hypothetical protein